ncbi:MAG: hypothetical protein U0359_16595 [Byssovorax sp.]
MRRLLAHLDRLARSSPLSLALGIATIVTAAYVILAPLFLVRYPAMTDLPFHAAQTSSIRHYLDPAYHVRDQFELHPIEVPYLSMYAIGAALMLVLPMLTAVKIAAAVMLALLPAGLAVMFHGMKKSPLLGLLGLGVTWSNLTHWGFLNFMGALGLFAMAVGLTFLLVDRPTRGRSVALGLTLIAVFFTHIFRFPFTLCAVVGVAVVMYPTTRRFRPIVAPLLPALALLLYWLRVRPASLGGEMGPLSIHRERLAELPGLLTGAFYDPAEKLAFQGFFTTAYRVALVCLAAALIRFLIGAGRDGIRWRLSSTIVVLCCTLVFLVAFLVLPMEIGLWWYVYPREATATCFLAFGLFPDLPRAIWLRAPLVLALAAEALGVGQVVLKNYRKFDQATEDFHAITRPIPLGPRLLYLVFDHGGSTRTTTPFIHLPAYVQAERGGWLSFHFAIWGSSPLRFRSPDEPGAVVPPPVVSRWEWKPQVFDLKKQGPFFDWFLVRRPSSPDGIFAADPTIKRVDHVGTWWLYRRVGPGG